MTRKILIVDDEEDIREVTALSLQTTSDWVIVAADSGCDAIERAAAEQPDAILMDVMMPGMDGPTTFEHLQRDSRTAGIPVILLTARVQSADQRRFAELGVAAVLTKPFDPLFLASQIAEALGWKH